MTAPRFAAFVSPHGFGHAARASAVLAEVQRRAGGRFELYTTAPRWFFDESLEGTFRYHEVEVDVGFRQKSALEFDCAETVRALSALVPFDRAIVARLAAEVRAAGCLAVFCDIAPLGVAVAEEAGLPSVLLENFSWPWLYEPLFAEAPELRELSDELDHWSARATRHVQARPVCERHDAFELVDPISREPRLDRPSARAAMGITDEDPLVVVTMGGYGEALPFLDQLRARGDTTFLVTGAGATGRDRNVLLFDNNTPLFMPDLLRAADAVVAKLGYGMVSEVWREGIPLAYVTRPDFREMASLEAFAGQELEGFLVSKDEYADGAWIERLPDLIGRPRRARGPGGAGRVAEVILEISSP